MDYPDDFKKAVDDLIDNWEGTEYTKTAGDAGGGTKFGISSTSYPKLDIKNLTRDDAVKIYYYDFWLPATRNVPSEFIPKVFNIGVLIGINEAKILVVGCSTIQMYREVLVKHFEAIVIKHPGDGKFLHGWTRRALS